MTTITLTKTVTAEPGTLGNLTSEQETCLQEAWAHILRLCGTTGVNHDARDHSYEFLQHFTDKTPATFQKSFWNSVLCDHPDDVVLRFLRARKWDVVKAVDMLVSAINWREERGVNTEIVAGGEAVALKKSHTPDEEAFMRQYHSGKSYIRGADKNGHPIYIIKVKLHDPNKQPASVMEDYALHNIETLRVMAKSRQDKVCLIFDLSGFGLKNMDFHFIKFLIQILEARYPETLSVVLVHNAPFVFWGIWSVIKHWLDPIIASKIHFTSGNKSLLPFISRDNLQKCYGGDDNWEYKYVEPVPTENDRMLSEEKKVKVLSEREEIIEQFTKTTAEWLALKADSDSAKEILGKERQEMAKELENNYWRLDPYIRSTTYYHRVGALTRQGDVDFKAAR